MTHPSDHAGPSGPGGHAEHTGRPLPAALALGFAGTALTCLLLREHLLLFCGNTLAMAASLAVLPLAMAAGTVLGRRRPAGRDPADQLAPLLGFLALCLPATLALASLVRPGLARLAGTALAPLAVLGSGLVAFLPVGLCLGIGLALVADVAGRKAPAPAARLPLPLAVPLAGVLGALFVQFVAIPKLSPLNACLDIGIGCAGAGLLCAAGAPGGRRLESWLSLLALLFVLLLPVSGLIDARLQAFAWQCPIDAIPATPRAAQVLARQEAPGRPSPTGLPTGLAVAALLAGALVALGDRKRLPGLSPDAARAAAAGLAEAAALVGLLLLYDLYAGALFVHLPALAAAFLAGETLGVCRGLGRREPSGLPAPALAPPCPAALAGAAAGCVLVPLVSALLS
ncbi:hypothetical protein DFW101_3178 [Solidesulfovibrio carbinoliphilus subsp. oakridgensis]|uniref:Uncharacterized protein n=1 Tax=Solidesulfovibrio carbinoliphilus subsp. oakridgensis TaxID=694327 RepID=G7Q9R2_9BACT|nr:hypothetical protein [Solidesulfovibrio carbinoliphilus]EHJ49178.1 hypothetical protein DFW101_3178 [Solidesulfovibrio carbinoliphilus subsp. oakridgensis]